MSLTKTAYQPLELAAAGAGRGHVFVNPITVKADVHFASAGEEESDDDGSDYHTGRSSEDIELVALKPNCQINKKPKGGSAGSDSGRLMSSNSNYSVSSYNYSDYEHVYEENDVVAFKPKKVAIAFEVLEDDDSLMNINEALNSLDEVLLLQNYKNSHLKGNEEEDECDSHSLYSFNTSLSGYSDDTTYSSLLSRRHSEMSADLANGGHVFYKEEKEREGDTTSCSSSVMSEATTTQIGSSSALSSAKVNSHDHNHLTVPSTNVISTSSTVQHGQHRRSSAPVAAVAAAVTIANFRKKSLAVPGTEMKKRHFIRRVERFGLDLADPCLFPLALPMDGSDIYKGASTWESLNLLADCVLLLWTEASEERRKNRQQIQQSSVSLLNNRRWENSVLGNNSSRYLVLQPALTDRLFLHPDCRLPFRRTASETDLTVLGIGEKDGLVGKQEAKNKKIKNLATGQMSVGGESVYSIVSGIGELGSREEENCDPSAGGAEADRNRSRSSLTTAYLGKRATTSLKEAAREQRKDRFNLNLTKNMKTEARRLASRAQLENAYKFAKKISKLEKRYYLAVKSGDFLGLVFKKGGGGGGGATGGELIEMIDFGQELSQLVADLICTEFTVDDQGSLLANVIETAFTLHQKGNLQSFKSVMRGLQLPEVYRLRSAWQVLERKFPLHLRVFTYLTVLMVRQVDQHTLLHTSAPCLPTLAAFLELLRIRCLSIWDQLEAAAEAQTSIFSDSHRGLHHHHHHHHHHHQPHQTGPSSGLVSLLSAHPVDEHRLEELVSARLTSDLEGKLRRYQTKQQQQLQKKKKRGKGGGKNDGSLTSASIPLKRLLHPESKTMATVLRKEAKLNGRPIGRETLSRLAKQVVAAGAVDCIDGSGPGGSQHQQQTSLLLPVGWSRRSLRHLPSQFQIPVIREFKSLYEQLIASIEAYRFGDWAES